MEEVKNKLVLSDQQVESNEFFDQFFDQSVFPSALIDVNTKKVIHANKKYISLLGYNFEELYELLPFELVARQDLDEYKSRFKSLVIGSITKSEFDCGFFNKSRELTKLKLVQSIVSFKDHSYVLEQILLNQSVENTELKFNEFFEIAFDGIEVIDTKQNKLLEINHRLCDLLRIKKDEVLGKDSKLVTLNQSAGEENDNLIREIRQKVKEDGKYKYKRTHHYGDGSSVELEVSFFSLPYPNEHILVGIFKDITEQVQTQSALRKSDTRFRLIFDKAYDGLYFFNYKEDKVVLGNSRLYELFETTPERIHIDKNYLRPEFQPDGTKTSDNLKKAFMQTLQHGRSRTNRIYQKSNGEIVHLEITTFIMSPPDDDIIITIYKDVTDQKLAELASIENHSQQEKLEAMQRELSTFTLFSTQKSKLLQELQADLRHIKEVDEDQRNFLIDKLIRRIGSNLDDQENWLTFKIQFERVFPGFFSNLQSIFPGLTNNDIKQCAYLKMNLSNAEIADLLFVGKKAVEMSHYRIKKKMNLEKGVSLKNAIAKI